MQTCWDDHAIAVVAAMAQLPALKITCFHYTGAVNPVGPRAIELAKLESPVTLALRAILTGTLTDRHPH